MAPRASETRRTNDREPVEIGRLHERNLGDDSHLPRRSLSVSLPSQPSGGEVVASVNAQVSAMATRHPTAWTFTNLGEEGVQFDSRLVGECGCCDSMHKH
jgi:ribonuclease PH